MLVTGVQRPLLLSHHHQRLLVKLQVHHCHRVQGTGLGEGTRRTASDLSSFPSRDQFFSRAQEKGSRGADCLEEAASPLPCCRVCHRP